VIALMLPYFVALTVVWTLFFLIGTCSASRGGWVPDRLSGMTAPGQRYLRR